MPVVVVATLTAKPESVDTVRDILTRAVDDVHREPGCQLYALHETGETFIFVEQWADAEALKAHSGAPRLPPCLPRPASTWSGAGHQTAAAGSRRRPEQRAAAPVIDRPLEGKVAFITGAARGLGRAHAVRLAADGANIIAVDICEQIASVPYPLSTADDLAATVELVEDAGGGIVARQGDVRDRASLSVALQAGLDEFGRLDIVVANAGIAMMQAGDDGWRDVIDVNLTGVFHTVQVAIPTLIEQGTGGSIVLISSAAGLVGIGSSDPGSLGYAAAKHGVVGLMRAYANHLAPQNIRVNSVHPCGVDTPMINNEFFQQWLTTADMDAPHNLGNALPVELVQPTDIANAVAWLASEEARYVTGVTLPVDAGFVNKR
ncbi:dehydrogenase [Mycobacterium tuberculosis variant bovis BCG]|nr:dehydrogenase [Mycobacterium tuberculosis variant bovis BCG]